MRAFRPSARAMTTMVQPAATETPTRPRLAVVVSHPIQYQAPWFRALARATDLTVLFCHKQDAADHGRSEFGVPFEWDIPLLDGYEYRWLTNCAARPDVSSFRGCDTPEIANILR